MSPHWDLPLGRELRDEGMALIGESEWRAKATAEILRLARSGVSFTADDVTDRIGLPMHVNAVGAVFRTAAGRGVIKRIGSAQALRPERHGNWMAEWTGTARAHDAQGVFWND